MKILKIEVLKDNKGECIYPPGFISINCLEHLYYDDLITNKTWLLVLINNIDIDKITDKTKVTELTIVETEILTNQYDPKTEVITDEAKIERLKLKVALGQELTVDEEKAIDQNDPTPGFGYKDNFLIKIKKRMGLV